MPPPAGCLQVILGSEAAQQDQINRAKGEGALLLQGQVGQWLQATSGCDWPPRVTSVCLPRRIPHLPAGLSLRHR